MQRSANSGSSRFMDMGTFIDLRDSVFSLTKLDFSLYDKNGTLIVPAASQDPIIEALTVSKTAKEQQEHYIREGIAKAILRRSSSLLRGPMNQYQYFMPLQVDNMDFVLVGRALYTSVNDLDEFILAKGSLFELSGKEMKILADKIAPSNLMKLSKVNEDVCHIFNLLLKDNYEKQLNKDRYRKAMSILELFSEIEEDASEDKIFGLISDVLVFLFGADTVSVMTRNNNDFITKLTAGRMKKQMEALSLKCDNLIVSDVLSRGIPMSVTATMDLLSLGNPDDVTSMFLFPLSFKKEPDIVVCVFNTILSREDSDCISSLCKFSGLLLKNATFQRLVDTNINTLTDMNGALNLNLAFREPDMLYESIVEASSRLLNAEKSSLMLPEDSKTELIIKAVKGMNKLISKSIRVKVGEGIAGMVYKEGRPMITGDLEKNLSMHQRSRYRTKSFVSIPIKIGDEVIGVLNISDKISGEVFSESDLTFIHYFASHAAIAIKGAHYFRVAEEMRTLSITDSITGLFNRRYFDERVYEEFQRASRYGTFLCLAILDIDDFKLFNDTEGHLSGDRALRAIADISKESIRSTDIIARIGGEEFAIIMPQTSTDDAYLVAERVRNNILKLMPLSWNNFPREKLTVSIGIACYDSDLKDVKRLIRETDKALYRAKILGKNRTIVADGSTDMIRKNTPR